MSLCFFLTAGLGTRLQPFTNIKPKPCLPFLNLPLMNYGFYLTHKAGFRNYLFNKHHLPQTLEANIKSLSGFCKNTKISDESSKILGSGGALWKAKEILSQHEYFLVANGDEILIPNQTNILSQLIEKFKMDQSLGILLTCDHPDLLKSLKPVWVDPMGQVQGFGMTQQSPKHRPVHYTGYKIFSKKILEYLPDGESNIFYDVVKSALAKGERVTTLHIDDSTWLETGNYQSFTNAGRDVAMNHWDYLKRVHAFYSQEIYLNQWNASDSALCFSEDQLPSDVIFKNFNVIGKKVIFGKNMTLNQSIICDHAKLTDDSIIQSSFVF